jgi:FkbM family methyltransferase
MNAERISVMAMLRRLARRTKHGLRRLQGKEPRFTIRVRCRNEHFGSDYGGWTLCPDELHSGSVVYSFGLGTDISFDRALIDRFGLVVHAFDPTPGSVAWLKQQPLPDNFILHEYGLASMDGTALFYPPENPEHISHSMLAHAAPNREPIAVPVYRISTITKSLGHERIDLLKMDVEGVEYEVIDDLLASTCNIRQMLVEFHPEWVDGGWARTVELIRRMEEHGLLLMHVSDSVCEFAFKQAEAAVG